MGKRKLIIGTIAGALLGALAMQFDKDTREYTKESLTKLKENSANTLNNPTEAVQNIRTAFDKLNANLEAGTANTLNALEQVENTLTKLANKN